MGIARVFGGYCTMGYHSKWRFCICKEGISHLPILTAFQGLKNLSLTKKISIFFLIFMLIMCVPNFKAKRFTQKKIFEIYQYV